MLHQDLVLKHNELYLVGEDQPDISRERATGLYVRDTRFLDHWELTLNGTPLEPLETRLLGLDRAVVIGANSTLPPDGLTIQEPVLPVTIADAPVPYPVSCSPQAWAAGSLPLLVRAMLGLEVDVQRACVLLQPALPEWLPRVRIEGLSALGQCFDLLVERDGAGYQVISDGPIEVASACERAHAR